MEITKSRKIIQPIAHILGWAGYFFIPVLINDLTNESDIFRYDKLWWVIQIFIVTLFYLNYLVLIPKLLFKKKYIIYALVIISLIVGLAYSIEFFITNGPQPIQFMHEAGDFPPPKPPDDHHGDGGPLSGMSVFLTVFIISTALRMSIEWFKNEKQRKELENDKLKAELEALKAQIDPHFFFNVLNNICSLARKKSDDTEVFIIKLSELIRYNLYENKGEKFFLEKEINFLKNYIEIQKMRLDKNAEINFNYQGADLNLMVEPMILYPFVENAFKHGISYNSTSKIDILIKTENKKLLFEITNPLINNPQSASVDKKSGGIGLKNVIKRLELLYPERHKITITDTASVFKVSLIIDL